MSEFCHSNGPVKIASPVSMFLDHWPTITSVCWLFLISFGLVAIIGGVFQYMMPGWGLILTEVFLILLPTLIFLWIGKYAIRQTLQLCWSHSSLVILGLLVGIALRPITIWTANMTYEFLHIPLPGVSGGEYTSYQTTLLLVGLTILAPICEELLFRGYIQCAFGKHGTWFGIFIAGVLFVVFHQSLISIPALLPLAFITGYIAWRCNSLIPAILLHMGYNVSLPLALVVYPSMEDSITSVKFTIPSLVITLFFLWLIWRITNPVTIAYSPIVLSPRWIFILTTITIIILFSLTSGLEILALTGNLP